MFLKYLPIDHPQMHVKDSFSEKHRNPFLELNKVEW